MFTIHAIECVVDVLKVQNFPAPAADHIVERVLLRASVLAAPKAGWCSRRKGGDGVVVGGVLESVECVGSGGSSW